MKTYRMLENGEEVWRGKAWDVEHAEEKIFWDESPCMYIKYTLEYWNKEKWVTVYENENIS